MIVDLHILKVWHAKRGLGVISSQEEVRLFIVDTGHGRVGGRGGSGVILLISGGGGSARAAGSHSVGG